MPRKTCELVQPKSDGYTKAEWYRDSESSPFRVWANGISVADCNANPWRDYDEMVANAQLITAAPGLLDALKYARRFLKAEDVDLAYIDASIAKATEEA